MPVSLICALIVSRGPTLPLVKVIAASFLIMQVHRFFCKNRTCIPGRHIEKDEESGMRHMKREQRVNDLIQPGGEGKRCAVPLALVAEPALRLSADPYRTPNPLSSPAPSGTCLR